MADVALEVLDDGSWAYESVTIFVQRRAGKTVLVEPVTMHRCSQGPRRSVWLTAQKRENAVKRWREIRDRFETSPFKPLVRSTIGTSHEAVRWPRTGSAFTPFAPDEESMHGEDPDLVWIDELWAFLLADRQKIQAGYRPAWSVKSGQEWKMSAAGTARSEWQKAERVSGRAAVEAGVTEGVAFFEWCIPTEVEGVPVEDWSDELLLQQVLANHPRAGRGLRASYLADELRSAKDDPTKGRAEFVRAYGGIDTDALGAVESAVPWEKFTAAELPEGEERMPQSPEQVYGIGFAVDPLSREGAVSIAWRRPDGVRLTEVVEVRPGVAWMGARLAELAARYHGSVLATNNIGPARRVLDELRAKGIECLGLTEADWQAACSRLDDAWTEGDTPTVRHLGEPELGAAVADATTRQLKSGAAWASRDGRPITVLEAHTLSVWAVDHLPEQPKRFGWTAF